MKKVDEHVEKYLIDRYELLKKEFLTISNNDDKFELLKEMKNLSILLYEKFGIYTEELKLR